MISIFQFKQFNETTKWVHSDCQGGENGRPAQTLVQASAANKKMLFAAIDALGDGGIANYTDAINFAYDAFNEVSV